MKLPAEYASREQAFVKHQILEHYLERLFMIIGQSRSSITYIDCFAGPWQDDSDDLKTSSIGISIRLMKSCQAALKDRGRSVSFRGIFIEKNPRAFSQLEAYLESIDEVETVALNGDFADLVSEIHRLTDGRGFSFFFVDPKGWKDVGRSTLAPLLALREAEFLINLMYDFVNRAMTQEAVAETIIDLFGVLPDLADQDPGTRRKKIVRAYRNRVKQMRPSPSWTMQVPIYRPDTDRILYYLVYSTLNERGIEVFAKETFDSRRDNYRAALAAKARKRSSNSGIEDLFGDQDLAALPNPEDAKHEEAIENAASFWRARLSSSPSKYGLRQLADIIDETDFTLEQLQLGFAKLVGAGLAINLDQQRKRKTNHINFLKGERVGLI